MEQGHQANGAMSKDMQGHHYRMLAVNLGLSLVIMYLGMFAMIWSFGEFIQNVNFLYMALVMWAPMAIVMMLTMKAMYEDKRLNFVLYGAFTLTLVLSFAAIRAQSLVGDKQYAEFRSDNDGAPVKRNIEALGEFVTAAMESLGADKGE